MLTRLARWWLERKVARTVRVVVVERAEECETCGEAADHRIVSGPLDDDDLGMMGDGGTMMSADFCAEHCPGGCRKGCAVG